MPGLILPEIVYNVTRKLGCIFKENHNSESLYLQKGQTIGVVTSCIVKQEELDQQPEERKKNTHCVAGLSYCRENSIGGASAGTQRK